LFLNIYYIYYYLIFYNTHVLIMRMSPSFIMLHVDLLNMKIFKIFKTNAELTTQQMDGEIFEIPRKYVLTEIRGKGSYGVVWYGLIFFLH